MFITNIKKNSGFSLIEVITVSVIIAILAAITVPTILGHETKRAKDAVTISAMSDFMNYANQRYHDLNTFGVDPGTGQTLCQYIRDEDERFADDNGVWGVGCSDTGDKLKCDEALNKKLPRNIKVLVAREDNATTGTGCGADPTTYESASGVNYNLVIQAEAASGHCIMMTDASPNNFSGGPVSSNSTLAVSDNPC